ncbi:hypothetical protein [Bradyrhizobium elkanii]|uniref:Uncharacterized protein n=1 Tax=Bradyrhizobium elkanii TaxID=29448 RepID=A0A8I2C992_BRAEL|nr:hypothetical protein [Bradyrhizobium elkanii]MBP1299964.1 hypothetical protein [Bradyrhizobium elkanii]MCP1975682.1 hypothetical protein [Bradyrhizobium elkanii]MCS3482447.1 hypothetical protein [Bradyrhizobium elkanii]MCS3525174.1 hypothetical protein [Bradyrhizobium elkanii]MCS4075923.1 hypothetical protein [Bradyrhizobium elkanii]
MPDPIDIPDEAFLAKPLFSDFPGADIVTEVREWVKGNPPWAWRGHTHAEPTVDEAFEIRYVADFQLPKGTESPCPCCTPRHPKFGIGFIAWFPRSACIRLMGRDCFRTLNPEGHDFAVRELDERQRREATIAYLTQNIEKRHAAIAALEQSLPLARQVDSLQEQLGESLRPAIGIDLWQQLRDGGQLKVVEETARGPIFVPYATVEGYALIDPSRKRTEPSVNTAIRHLKNIDLASDVADASDTEREAAAKAFQRGMVVGREVLDVIADCRRFVSVLSFATLRNWGNQDNAPARLYARRDGHELYIGRSEDSVRRITLDACIDLSVPVLPQIAV